MIKKALLVLQVLFYLAAGVNHFANPAGYIKIIQAYLPFPAVLNYAAGAAEILLALLLIPLKTRRMAAWGIVLMLIAFLPVHISMIADAPLQVGSITVTPFIAWLRLLFFQPLFMVWAWWYTRVNLSKY